MDVALPRKDPTLPVGRQRRSSSCAGNQPLPLHMCPRPATQFCARIVPIDSRKKSRVSAADCDFFYFPKPVSEVFMEASRSLAVDPTSSPAQNALSPAPSPCNVPKSTSPRAVRGVLTRFLWRLSTSPAFRTARNDLWPPLRPQCSQIDLEH